MRKVFCPVCGAFCQATASGLVKGAQSYTARCPQCRTILHVRDWPNGTSDVSWVRPQDAVRVPPAEPGHPGIPKPVRLAWEDDHMVALECEQCDWKSVYSAWVSARTLAEEAIEHVRRSHGEQS